MSTIAAAAATNLTQGVNGIDPAKSFSASARETLKKVWDSISDFFSTGAKYLSTWMGIAKEGFLKGVGQIKALPLEAKVLTGAAIGLTALLTAFFCKGSCKSVTEKPVETPVATETGKTEPVPGTQPESPEA